MTLINGLHSFDQISVLISLPDNDAHYVTWWCQSCRSSQMVLETLFSCPVWSRPGCTCGQVSKAVTMVSIIRAPGWCNDKGGALLSVISSCISIYFPHHREHHHTDSRSRMQFSIPQGFPCRCHTFSGHPLIQQCYCSFLVFPSTVIAGTSLLQQRSSLS